MQTHRLTRKKIVSTKLTPINCISQTLQWLTPQSTISFPVCVSRCYRFNQLKLLEYNNFTTTKLMFSSIQKKNTTYTVYHLIKVDFCMCHVSNKKVEMTINCPMGDITMENFWSTFFYRVSFHTVSLYLMYV